MSKWKLYKDYSDAALTTIELEDNLTAQEIADKLIDLGYIQRTEYMNDLELATYKDVPGICLFDDVGWRLARLVKVTEEPTLAQVAAQTQTPEKNLPRCPTCGSTNLQKLNAAIRAIDGWFFGRHSVEGRAQFWCKNCNYRW